MEDSKAKRTNHRKNNIIIGSLLIIVLLMVAGYAAFSSKLDIKGTTNITSKWKVILTKIKIEKTKAIFNELSANININLTSPGDSIKYAITVFNEGTLNAVLDSIKTNMKTDYINFKVKEKN